MHGRHHDFDRDKSLINVIYLCLRRIRFFANVSEKFLISVAKIAKTETWDQDKTIYEQGENTSTMYYVRVGNVELKSVRGETLVLGPEECFGELGFLNLAQKRISTATTLTICYTLSFDRAEFVKCLKRSKRDASILINDVNAMMTSYPHAKALFEKHDKNTSGQFANLSVWDISHQLKKSSKDVPLTLLREEKHRRDVIKAAMLVAAHSGACEAKSHPMLAATNLGLGSKKDDSRYSVSAICEDKSAGEKDGMEDARARTIAAAEMLHRLDNDI